MKPCTAGHHARTLSGPPSSGPFTLPPRSSRLLLGSSTSHRLHPTPHRLQHPAVSTTEAPTAVAEAPTEAAPAIPSSLESSIQPTKASGTANGARSKGNGKRRQTSARREILDAASVERNVKRLALLQRGESVAIVLGSREIQMYPALIRLDDLTQRAAAAGRSFLCFPSLELRPAPRHQTLSVPDVVASALQSEVPAPLEQPPVVAEVDLDPVFKLSAVALPDGQLPAGDSLDAPKPLDVAQFARPDSLGRLLAKQLANQTSAVLRAAGPRSALTCIKAAVAARQELNRGSLLDCGFTLELEQPAQQAAEGAEPSEASTSGAAESSKSQYRPLRFTFYKRTLPVPAVRVADFLSLVPEADSGTERRKQDAVSRKQEGVGKAATAMVEVLLTLLKQRPQVELTLVSSQLRFTLQAVANVALQAGRQKLGAVGVFVKSMDADGALTLNLKRLDLPPLLRGDRAFMGPPTAMIKPETRANRYAEALEQQMRHVGHECVFPPTLPTLTTAIEALALTAKTRSASDVGQAVDVCIIPECRVVQDFQGRFRDDSNPRVLLHYLEVSTSLQDVFRPRGEPLPVTSAAQLELLSKAVSLRNKWEDRGYLWGLHPHLAADGTLCVTVLRRSVPSRPTPAPESEAAPLASPTPDVNVMRVSKVTDSVALARAIVAETKVRITAATPVRVVSASNGPLIMLEVASGASDGLRTLAVAVAMAQSQAVKPEDGAMLVAVPALERREDKFYVQQWGVHRWMVEKGGEGKAVARSSLKA